MVVKSASPVASQILAEIGLSDLPGDWGIVRIESLLCDDRGISVGVMYPGDHDPEGVPLVKSGDIARDHINPKPEFRITKDKHYEYRRTAFMGGELLISLVGDVGRCALVPHQMAGWNAARAIAVLRLRNTTDAEFVRACLMSEPLQYLMQAWSTTTVQATLNLKEIRQIPLPWPPKKQRLAISRTLGVLDDKIELNRRMNETLEAMARALFKDWFVDFGPTRAKQEGLEPYLAPHLWSLFPERLDREGKPEGWKCGTLTDVADLNSESWSAKCSPDHVEYVDLANTKWGTIEATERYLWSDAPSRARRVLRLGDTIVGTVRPGNGSYAFIGQDGLTGSTGFAVLRPKQPLYREVVYFAATAPENIERLSHRADGAAYPAVRPDVVGNTEFIKGVISVIQAFSYACAPLVDRMEANKQESRTLAQTRDLLLPKLMSGEIRVKDAEKTMEAHL